MKSSGLMHKKQWPNAWKALLYALESYALYIGKLCFIAWKALLYDLQSIALVHSKQ
jgi:hypothetical protein